MAVKICGHRGTPYIFPENTLKSFLKAVEQGVDAVEMDVRRTLDNHLVACHDYSLSRLAGKHTKLSEITLDEFKQLKIHHRQSPATIEEIINAVGDKLDIIFDVKETGLGKSLLGLIQRYNLQENIIVSSFFPAVIMETKRINPDIKTALIAGPFSILPLAVNIAFYLRRAFNKTRADYMHLAHLRGLYNGYKSLISEGYKLSFWTVNTSSDIINCSKLNPEYIITNRPHLAGKLLNSTNYLGKKER